MTEKDSSRYIGCSAIMSTLTNAQMAQKVLAAAAIPSNVVKAPPSEAHRGCAWSVSFSCNQMQNVKTVLSANGISVRAWESG